MRHFIIIFQLLCGLLMTLGEHVFERNPSFDGLVCSQNSINFVSKQNKLSCARECSRSEICRSFLYDLNSSDCFSFDTLISDTAGCLNQNGYFYHLKGSTIATTTTTTTTNTASSTTTTPSITAPSTTATTTNTASSTTTTPSTTAPYTTATTTSTTTSTTTTQSTTTSSTTTTSTTTATPTSTSTTSTTPSPIKTEPSTTTTAPHTTNTTSTTQSTTTTEPSTTTTTPHTKSTTRTTLTTTTTPTPILAPATITSLTDSPTTSTISTTLVSTTTSIVTPCQVIGDCQANANLACIDSTCQCTDWFRYSPSSDMCVADCPVGYGNTYIRRANKIPWTNINLMDILQTTLEKCYDQCSSNPSCSGVSWNELFKRCSLKQEIPDSYYMNSLDSDWYTRNCL